MAAKRERKYKKVSTQQDVKNPVVVEMEKVQAKKAGTGGSRKEKAPLKKDDALVKAQQALKTAKAKLARERRARLNAEKALAEAEKTLKAVRLKTDQEHQVQIRRISFVVRLMVGENGKPLRTEIEQVESSRKQNFLGLNGERLVAFMKAYIDPIVIPQDDFYGSSSMERLTIPPPGAISAKSGLRIYDVQVFRLEDPEIPTLFVPHDEPFIVQTRFQLLGPDAKSLISQESSLMINVYANEIVTGKSKLLRTYSIMPIRNIFEYNAPIEVQGLSPGFYRLFTTITLRTSPATAGFYGKTIVHVD